ncbi:outer membrane protein with beta-barrel domain [Halanaerobium saccharolyticum]|uniref:Outer membrane protein with beta-barrel domain n=1 Tax=Halanaerobium saccharolyticum TaxID=43595 RepID=A0A4R6M073_9FIRM|nr:outer membrane beta-barrel protein [Halanaerobium saccharolyticum]TDO93905.1 outer membrane protein with beta-barrel domain [Halanaerobium saccharolyticum]
MKKLMVVLIVMAFMLFSFNVFAQAQSSWSVKLGIDFASEMDVDEESYDTEMGYSVTGEYIMPYRNGFDLGAGITLQMDRDFEDYDGDFGFTPIYGLAEYTMDDGPLYFIGHLGFASFRVNHPEVENSSGGLYYALGAGMYITDQYTADILYTNNSGEIEYTEGGTSDADYSKFTVSVGMRF